MSWHKFDGPRIPYLGFGLTETHVVELEKYFIMGVKDRLGTEGQPLCKTRVAAAKAKAAAESDKPKDMTLKDRRKQTKTAENSPQPQRTQRRTATRIIRSTASNPTKQRTASSPISRRCHRTRAAAIVFEQMCF